MVFSTDMHRDGLLTQIFIATIRKAIFFYYAIGQNIRLCETHKSRYLKDVCLTENYRFWL